MPAVIRATKNQERGSTAPSLPITSATSGRIRPIPFATTPRTSQERLASFSVSLSDLSLALPSTNTAMRIVAEMPEKAVKVSDVT